MSEDERGPDPGEVFRPLKSRPTPELDGEDLWRRTAARLAERPGRLPWWRLPWSAGRPGEGATPPASLLAWGTVAAAVLVLAVGSGLFWSLTGPADPSTDATGERVAGRDAPAGGEDDAAGRDDAASRLVLLGSADGASGADADADLDVDLRLRVRLIRGYDGEPPADGREPDLQGAGGTDELHDLRARLGGLLAYPSYGLTGRWQGGLGEALQRGIALGPDAVLHVVALTLAREGGTVSVDLVGLRLNVDGKELSTPRLRLVPGRVYLLGLPDEREPRGPSRVLAVEAELAEGPRRP